MKYNIKENASLNARLARFAVKVWGVNEYFGDHEQAALEGISRMENFFRSIGMPVRFNEANIDPARIPEMAKRAVHFGPIGNYLKLEEKDAEAIYRLAAK